MFVRKKVKKDTFDKISREEKNRTGKEKKEKETNLIKNCFGSRLLATEFGPSK